MSEFERDFGVDEGAGSGGATPAGEADGTADGWEAWEVAADEAPAAGAAATPARAGGGVLDGLQPPWLMGALSAALVVLAGAVAFAAARRGLGVPPGGVALVGVGLAAGGALALAALAGWTVSTLASRYHREHAQQREVIDRVAALDLESSDGWHDPTLRAELELGRFLDALLARDQRQRTALARAAIIDGELARLGGALAATDRTAATAGYEMPAVARAAEGAAQLFTRIDRADEARVTLEAKLTEAGGQAAASAASARRWQQEAGARLVALHEGLRGLGAELHGLGQTFARRLEAFEESERLGVPTLAEVADVLPAAAAHDRAGRLAETAHTVKDLVARGGSLAIQTALEATRLGERGESLFPLTEGLKGLVTDFQGVAMRLEQAARDEQALAAAVASAHASLAQIIGAPGRETPETEAWRGGVCGLDGLRTSLVRTGTELGALGQSFAEQAARLEALAGALAELTSEDCEPLDAAANVMPPATFEIESFGAPASGFAAPAPAATLIVPPPPQTAGPPMPRLFVDEAEPFEKAASSPLLAETLADSPDRIYDLVELGAVALDASPPAAASDEDERIWDLCELGAVALG